MDRKDRTPANAAYDLFITAASVLSIFNLILLVLARNEVVDSVILIIELFLGVIFLLDFLARLRRAESKAGYFLREASPTDQILRNEAVVSDRFTKHRCSMPSYAITGNSTCALSISLCGNS